MSDRIHVAVLMGGKSSEHEISLKSGRGVAAALDRDRFLVTPVVIGLDNRWTFGDESLSAFDALPRLRDLGVACVFLALHGPYGEDGRMQGLLDMVGLPYTGSGCAASALAMDKVRCKAVVQSQGIPVAGHVALDQASWDVDAISVIDAVQAEIGFPCIVKPAGQGSSKGVRIPASVQELRPAIAHALEFERYLMIEQFISGKELTCGVLDIEPGRLRALPVTEIVPRTASFFDYEAKYTPGATEEITPGRITPEEAEQVSEMAAHVHEIVGCSGWSRSDFILGPEGPVWIEVNTIPGLTETSLYPQACATAGISYADMAAMFIDAALRAAREQEGHKA